MTPDEFAEKMAYLYESNDTEMKHRIADDLMCEVLTRLGYEEGVQIFYNMTKWYS